MPTQTIILVNNACDEIGKKGEDLYCCVLEEEHIGPHGWVEMRRLGYIFNSVDVVYDWKIKVQEEGGESE